MTYYPNLVRVFYCNMELKNDTITSNVKGVPISFTVKELGEALDISYEGAKIKINHNANLPGYEKNKFYYGIARIYEQEFFQKSKKIVGGNPERKSRATVIFTIDYKLIHYFLAYVVVSNFSNFSIVNDCEMHILYAIKNNI